jgi:hypothetical protein
MTEKPAIGKGGRVPRIQTVTGNISFAFCSLAVDFFGSNLLFTEE